jgi:hypothetical protein
MTIAGIATLKTRAVSFKQTIESIYPQVDRIYAVLNNYDRIPAWLKKYNKVIAILGSNHGDAGKFLFVGICDNSYYFSFDDDLVYPADYVDMMKQRIDKYHCICSLHGKKYKYPISDWRKDFYVNIRCLDDVTDDIPVHVGGTGVMAFHTNDFKLSISDFDRPNMADVLLAKVAAKQGVPIMGISHHKGYLKYIPPEDTPIWHQNIDGEYQTGIINEFLKLGK